MPTINIKNPQMAGEMRGGGSGQPDSMVFRLFKRWMDTGNPGDLDALIAAGSAYKNIGRFFGLAKGGGLGGGSRGGGGGGGGSGGAGPSGPPPKIDIRVTGRSQDNSAVVAALRELGAKLDRLIAVSTGEASSMAHVASRRRTLPPIPESIMPGAIVPWQVRQATIRESIVGSRPWMAGAFASVMGGGRGRIPGSWITQWAELQDLRARGLHPSLPLLTGPRPARLLPPPIIEGASWIAPPNAAGTIERLHAATGRGFTLGPSGGFGGHYGLPVPAGRWLPATVPNFTLGGGAGGGGGGMPPVNLGGPAPIPLGRMPIYGAMSRLPMILGIGSAIGTGLFAASKMAQLGVRIAVRGLPFARFGMHAQGLAVSAGVPVRDWLNTLVPGIGHMPRQWLAAGLTQQRAISLLQSFPGVPHGPGAQSQLLGIPAALVGGQFFPGLAGMPLGQIAGIGTQGVQFGLNPGGGYAAQALHWEVMASRFAQAATLRGIPRTGFLNTLGSSMSAIAAQGAPISGSSVAEFITPFFSAPGVGIAQANAMSMRAITGQPRAVNRLMGSAFGRYVITLAAQRLSPGAGGGLERTIGSAAYSRLVASNPAFFQNYAATYAATGPSSPITQAYTASLLRHIQGVAPGAMTSIMKAVGPSLGAGAVPGLTPLFLGRATGMGLWDITTRGSFSGFGPVPQSAVEKLYGSQAYVNARLLAGPYSSGLNNMYGKAVMAEGVVPYMADSIVRAAKGVGISPLLLGAIVGQESGGGNLKNATSGAFGPGQLTPSAVRDIAQNLGYFHNHGFANMYLPPASLAHASDAKVWGWIHSMAATPFKNLQVSAEYIRLLQHRYHNAAAVAAHYYGTGVAPPGAPTTKQYVQQVMHRYALGTGLSPVTMSGMAPQDLVGYEASISSFGLGTSRIAFRAGNAILATGEAITSAADSIVNAIQTLDSTLQRTNSDLEHLPGVPVTYHQPHGAHMLPGVHVPNAPVYRAPR